ncbi:MAG: CPBP family glutamic-type intramembrane protease [Thermogutta sp.]
MGESVFRALIIITLAWWGVICASSKVRKSLWPRYHFSPLKWRFRDVLFFWIVFFGGMSASGLLFPLPKSGLTESSSQSETLSAQAESQPHGENDAAQHAHWVLVLIRADRSWQTWLLCLLATGVLAPIVEEFLFRGLLQGWCHTLELQGRHRVVSARKIWGKLPVGALSIGVVAMLFAMVHYRPTQMMPSPEAIKTIVARQAVAYLLFLMALLTVVTVVKPTQKLALLFHRRWFLKDLTMGVGWFVATVTPLYFVQGILKLALAEKSLADPLTMVFVGAILGTLFARTGRLTPSVVFHILLNVTSLSLALLL